MFINLDEHIGEKDLNWQVVSIIQQNLQNFLFFITKMKKILGMKICG